MCWPCIHDIATRQTSGLRSGKVLRRARTSDTKIRPANEWIQGSEHKPNCRETPVETQGEKWGSRECPCLRQWQDFSALSSNRISMVSIMIRRVHEGVEFARSRPAAGAGRRLAFVSLQPWMTVSSKERKLPFPEWRSRRPSLLGARKKFSKKRDSDRNNPGGRVFSEFGALNLPPSPARRLPCVGPPYAGLFLHRFEAIRRACHGAFAGRPTTANAGRSKCCRGTALAAARLP